MDSVEVVVSVKFVNFKKMLKVVNRVLEKMNFK